MRVSTQLTKPLAVAAILAASVTIPALLAEVGALDAVGLGVSAPSAREDQLVVAVPVTPAVAVPRRVARKARTLGVLDRARSPQAATRANGALPRTAPSGPAAASRPRPGRRPQPSAPVSSTPQDGSTTPSVTTPSTPAPPAPSTTPPVTPPPVHPPVSTPLVVPPPVVLPPAVVPPLNLQPVIPPPRYAPPPVPEAPPPPTGTGDSLGGEQPVSAVPWRTRASVTGVSATVSAAAVAADVSAVVSTAVTAATSPRR